MEEEGYAEANEETLNRTWTFTPQCTKGSCGGTFVSEVSGGGLGTVDEFSISGDVYFMAGPNLPTTPCVARGNGEVLIEDGYRNTYELRIWPTLVRTDGDDELVVAIAAEQTVRGAPTEGAVLRNCAPTLVV